MGLTLYTFKLFWEWWKGDSDDEAESVGSSGTTDPSSMEGSWEVAWDPVCEKYYYQDRARGVSSWCRPTDCTFDLPQERPGNSIGAFPAAPTGLPLGWSAAWDCKSQCFYFYSSRTRVRTWERPGSNVEANTESTCEASCPVPAAWGDDVLSLDAVQVGHLDGEPVAAAASKAPGDQDELARSCERTVETIEAQVNTQ